MSWYSDIAKRAESLLINIDEQTGVALKNQNLIKSKTTPNQITHPGESQKKKRIPRREQPYSNLYSNTNYDCNKNKSYKFLSPTKESNQSLSTNNKNITSTKLSRNVTQSTTVNYAKIGDSCSATYRMRRNSLPSDIEKSCTITQQYKLEVENAMMKKELGIVNKEFEDLYQNLKEAEDDITLLKTKLQTSEQMYEELNNDNKALTAELHKLKLANNDTNEINKYKEWHIELEKQLTSLKGEKAELESRCQILSENIIEKENLQSKLETELRHSQSLICELQSNLERSTLECKRLEDDWNSYKLRVKSMLIAKDNQIQSLQSDLNVNEATKMLLHELETLKEEREELSESLTKVRGECENMKVYLSQLEERSNATERTVTALRDALREERSLKNKAESQCHALTKKLKSLQAESNQIICNLRQSLHEKEEEIENLKATTFESDSSALNVADYERESVEREKIEYLTNLLMQKQGNIDALMADNNVLKIQLGKLESKYKSEMAFLRCNSAQVAKVEEVKRSRTGKSDSMLSNLSLKMGVFLRRNPIFRIFVIVYMIGLHFWVLTVLFNIKPEVNKQFKIKI